MNQQNRLCLYHSRGVSEGRQSGFYSKIAPSGQFGVDNRVFKELIIFSSPYDFCPLTHEPADKILATLSVLELY